MSSKTDIVMAVLATGIYRPWFWQHYPTADQQAVLREQYARVVARYSREDVRAALSRWCAEKGVSTPPTPEGLLNYLRPVDSASRRQFFETIKTSLKSEHT